MKSYCKYTLLALASVVSTQAATLTFTNSGLGAYATGFGDAASNISSGLIWGVVVDNDGDGFDVGNWDAGFTYTGGNTSGIPFSLTTTGLPSDDLLFINTSVTSNLSSNADGAVIGTGRVNSIVSVTFGSQLAGGEAFGIIWFNRGIALGSVSADDQKYGFITSGTNAAPAFLLPGATSDTIDYSAAFAGPDPVKTASFTLGVAIPEPSAAILGAIGSLGLLGRRRN